MERINISGRKIGCGDPYFLVADVDRDYRLKQLLLLVVLVVPFIFFAYTTFITPRPYYFGMTDTENDYYYNARLLYEGLPVHEINHPGTPLYYLSSLILFLSGPDLNATQRFSHFSHFIVALTTAASLYAFAHTLLFKENIPIGISALIVASIWAWPPFLAYLNYFSPDSFVVALGLPTIAIFWTALRESNQKLCKRKLFLCGLGIGACLVTKLSFLPVAVALLIACSIHVLLALRSLKALSLLPAGVAVSCLLLTAPIFGRLPDLLIWTIVRDYARPNFLNFTGTLFENLGSLLAVSAPLTIIMAIATAYYLYLFGTYVYRHLMKPGSLKFNKTVTTEDLGYLSGGMFLLLMLFAFVYTLTSTNYFNNRGPMEAVLRNVSPSALFMPFLILYCYRLGSLRWTPTRMVAGGLQILLALAALVSVTVAVIIHLDRRQEFIGENRNAEITDMLEKLKPLSRPNTRIAFWDHGVFGEASFHFWGNYRYAHDLFDQMLVKQYPDYTFFRFREVPRILREMQSPHNSATSKNKDKPCKRLPSLPLLCRLWRSWHNVFPSPYVHRTNELVAGERHGVKVSLIAFRKRDSAELRKSSLSLSDLLSLIQSRFGPPKVWEQTIEGIDWLLISVPE